MNVQATRTRGPQRAAACRWVVMDADASSKPTAARRGPGEAVRPRLGAGGRALVERTRAAADLSEPLLEAAARRLRTLGHPTRLRLVGLLIAGPRSVGDLADELDVRRDQVSKHLAELLAVRAVRRAREGNFVLYALSDAVTPQLVALACEAAQRDALRLGRLGAEALAADSAAPPARDGRQ